MAKEEIARFYTRSRRFPKMIGRMTDGSRIPGGPYTLTQVGFGGVALMGLLVTRTLWGTGATLLDLAITVGVAWGVTWLVGLIPMTRRNLVLAFVGAVARTCTTDPVLGVSLGSTSLLTSVTVMVMYGAGVIAEISEPGET